VTDLFLGPNGSADDDAPTIISKGPPAARHPEGAAAQLRGQRLAHFELLEPIGVGGMAAVIRARDLQLDRSVALKILPPEMASDPENIRRFHQEARAAARLDHENIARVFFCGEDQKLHFIAFEFVEGENLRVLLERRGRLGVPEAVHYMLQVATGLAHAAARGVVHRDIKPSNIIISPSGRAKLVDMGLARSLEPRHDAGLTQSGVTLGTFDYISPEQALEPRDADVRSDIYSLGCTFYHMLTGVPPVPEGTAAKKLHHHQHVAPVDPRQLNPAIPDDVAAILAHMMAKDPKDRYQRAEHLVGHLLGVAQKLGAVTEAPDGVLFVDAPLPGPVRKRPAMMVALAIIALSTLLAVLSLAPTDSPRLPGASGGRRGQEKEPTDRGQAGGQGNKAVEPGDGDGRSHVRTVRQLAALLARQQPLTHIYLDNDLNLTPEGRGADEEVVRLLCRGDAERRVILESARDDGQPYTLSVTYPGRQGGAPRWPGLTVAGPTVTLRNLRLEVRGKVPTTAEPLALLAVSAGKLVLERCRFVQRDWHGPSGAPAPGHLAVAMVRVEAATAARPGRPEVECRECYFESGQSAVAVAGAATVRCSDCAFGPHAALFHFREGSSQPNTLVHLSTCSVLVDAGPVFRLDRAGATFVVQHSIFSHLGVKRTADDLLLQTDSTTGERIRYSGQRNCYHNLNAFWKRYRGETDVSTYTLAAFRSELARTPTRSRDEGSTELDGKSNPWESGNPTDAGAGVRKFRLKAEMAELRQEGGALMIGTQSLLGEPLYDEELPALPERKPAEVVRKSPKVKIVDPDADATGNGVYLSLEGAISEAKSGDEIQIKHNGTLKVPPVWLEKAIDLKIKPYPDFHPVLTLARTTQRDAALFRLNDGQVQFEALEFQLTPNKNFDFLTVVEMIGNGQCTFKDCVLTLREADKERKEGKRPSVVRLTDPAKAMRVQMGTSAPRTAPEIRVTDCLVRGQGDLVAVLPSRPLDLDVSNVLLALEGSLLHVDGTVKDPPAAAATADSNNHVVKLARVTAYLTEPLLRLRAKTGKGLVGTTVKRVADCLFIAGAKELPLIKLEGLESKELMERLFSWEGSEHNTYLNFETMLDASRSSYSQEDWQKSPGNVTDKDPVFDKCKKLKRPLSEVVPADFKEVKTEEAKTQLAAFGANLEKLPKLAPAEPAEAEGGD
jgi:hypothetical protein